MKPYGLRKHDDTVDDSHLGPPTKVAPKIRSKSRKTSRRLLHKQGRNDAKKELKKSD